MNMNLLTRKYKVKAKINHVFHCFSDIDYLHTEFNKISNQNEKKLKIIKQNKSLEFIGKSSIFKLKEIEVVPSSLYRAEIIPTSKSLMRFGGATIVCTFSENEKYTKVLTKITSNKEPSFFWKIFIRVIVLGIQLQSRTDEKVYIRNIEKNA